MRIQLKLRSLLLVIFAVSVLFAVRSRIVANATKLVESIGEPPKWVVGGTEGGVALHNDMKVKLLSDANLSSSRYSLKEGLFCHPKVILMPRSLSDHLLMRSTYRIEFKTWDNKRKPSPAVGAKLFHNRHESDYQTGVFGVKFVQSVTNRR